MNIVQNFKCFIANLGGTLHFSHWHKLRIIEKFGRASSKLQCNNCKKYFAMSDSVKVILDWDSDFDDLKKRVNNIWGVEK